jgi:hypothetical protein
LWRGLMTATLGRPQVSINQGKPYRSSQRPGQETGPQPSSWNHTMSFGRARKRGRPARLRSYGPGIRGQEVPWAANRVIWISDGPRRRPRHKVIRVRMAATAAPAASRVAALASVWAFRAGTVHARSAIHPVVNAPHGARNEEYCQEREKRAFHLQSILRFSLRVLPPMIENRPRN